MIAAQQSTAPIVIGMVVAGIVFVLYLPVMIRDSRRPLRPAVRRPVIVREPRPQRVEDRWETVTTVLSRLRPPDLSPAPSPVVSRFASAGRSGTPRPPAPITLPAPKAGEPAIRRRGVLVVAAAVVAVSLVTPRATRTRRVARR